MNALDSALTPLKPHLRTVIDSLPTPVDKLALSLLGVKCHHTLLQNLDFSLTNINCINLAISKALGTSIIAAASIVKVPQLIKLASSQSAAGLSFTSYLLEVASFTITLAYSVRNNFPFTAYGETALIAVQDVAIGALILLYSGRGAAAATFVAGVAAVAYALFAPGVLDARLLTYAQGAAGVMGIASKVPQIWTVARQGGTGQLSAFAVFNYLAGSASRIYTTMQEVDDPLILYGYIAGFVLNAVLAGQMIYYWNSPVSSESLKMKPVINHAREKMPVGSSSGFDAGSSPSSAAKKGPSTRRRG